MKKANRKGERFKGATLGLDLHKAFIEWCLFDAKGDEKESGRIKAGRKDLLRGQTRRSSLSAQTI